MKQRVHIHTLEVTAQGQIINFQVRIPRDAKRIVGILITENAAVEGAIPSERAIAFDISRPRILFPVKVGTLILQSKDKANIFYGEDVVHSDNSFAAGDFTIPFSSPSRRIEGRTKKDFTGGAKWKELCIEIDVQNTRLFGIYKDDINEKMEKDSDYQVKLYFFYEQKTIA